MILVIRDTGMRIGCACPLVLLDVKVLLPAMVPLTLAVPPALIVPFIVPEPVAVRLVCAEPLLFGPLIPAPLRLPVVQADALPATLGRGRVPVTDTLPEILPDELPLTVTLPADVMPVGSCVSCKVCVCAPQLEPKVPGLVQVVAVIFVEPSTPAVVRPVRFGTLNVVEQSPNG